MRVLVAAIIALVALLAVVPSSGAATRRATDRATGVRFVLDGRVLTTRLTRRTPRRVRRQLYGRRIRAVCGTSFVFSRAVKVRSTRRWPRGRRTVRFRFRRDISRRAKWCLLEYPRGRDIAFASFPR